MIIDRLSADVLQDDYFKNLYVKASKRLACSVFLEKNKSNHLTEKELIDLLRFADILSNAKNPLGRNRAYQVITLLNSFYSDNAYYKTFAHSVMAKLGNFPGLEYLKLNDENHSQLPFDHEIEKSVKEFIQAVPDTKGLIFTDSQFDLYKQLSVSKIFSFSGPTSMGKSFIIKSFIRKAVSNRPPDNIVIMVPTRALINQFSIDFKKELKETLEQYNYKVVTNSNVSDLPADKQQRYLLVLTPERLLSFLSQKENPPIGYLFVDEAHKMAAAKDTRAITAYNAISKALRQNPNLNLYFSSPNVSNPGVFLKLFDRDEKKSFRTIETPVSQNLFFVDLTVKNVTHYLDPEPYTFAPKAIASAKGIPEVISAIGKNSNNIVYCSSRFQAVDKAFELCKVLDDEFEPSKALKKVITQIKGYIHKDYYLAEFLKKGVAYHFGNLPQIIRNKVEGLFKQSEVSYVFCTSTLLEGVNLPAKNIFVLNDKNGRNTLLPIDFWNLAGRAGRLRFELSGNIFCVKETEKDWKHVELLEKKTDIVLTPTVEKYIDDKLKKIEEFINENPEIKVESQAMREILSYIANIISIDTLEIKRSNYQSSIIKKLIEDNKEHIIELAKKKNAKVEIPSNILSANQSVKLKIQDDVYKKLKTFVSKPATIKLPSKVDYETCKTWLTTLHKLFKWDIEEAKHFKSVAQISYYASLMNQWINGIPLSQIINQSITYYTEKKKKIQIGFTPQDLVVFDSSNKKHVNTLIGDIIEDIEYILRFLFEKYFNNYYSMLIEILGEDNAGPNWATFLEYGTRNSIIIALQNYGLSRHSANHIYLNYKSCLKIEGDKLMEINIQKLKQLVSKEDIEYDEIASILF